MSVVQQSVGVCKEVDDVLAAVVNLVAAVKAKKTVPEIVAAELPAVIALIGEVGALPGDFLSEKAECVNAALLRSVQLVDMLVSK